MLCHTLCDQIARNILVTDNFIFSDSYSLYVIVRPSVVCRL